MLVHGAASLAMQSLKKTGHIFVHCMPCDKGRNGAWRRSEAACSAARRSESQSPEPRHAFASVSGGQGGQARKATKARRIPLARTLVIFELRADGALAGPGPLAAPHCRWPSPACVHAWKAPSGRPGAGWPDLAKSRDEGAPRWRGQCGGGVSATVEPRPPARRRRGPVAER